MILWKSAWDRGSLFSISRNQSFFSRVGFKPPSALVPYHSLPSEMPQTCPLFKRSWNGSMKTKLLGKCMHVGCSSPYCSYHILSTYPCSFSMVCCFFYVIGLVQKPRAHGCPLRAFSPPIHGPFLKAQIREEGKPGFLGASVCQRGGVGG